LKIIHTTSEVDLSSGLLTPSESLLSEPCIDFLFFFLDLSTEGNKLSSAVARFCYFVALNIHKPQFKVLKVVKATDW